MTSVTNTHDRCPWLTWSRFCIWLNQWLNNKQKISHISLKCNPYGTWGPFEISIGDPMDPPNWRIHYSDVIMIVIAASQFFTQLFIQVQIKENIKALPHWPLWGEFTGDNWIPHIQKVIGEFPTQRACNPENVSTWWCHHVVMHFHEGYLQNLHGTLEKSMWWGPLSIHKNVCLYFSQVNKPHFKIAKTQLKTMCTYLIL